MLVVWTIVGGLLLASGACLLCVLVVLVGGLLLLETVWVLLACLESLFGVFCLVVGAVVCCFGLGSGCVDPGICCSRLEFCCILVDLVLESPTHGLVTVDYSTKCTSKWFRFLASVVVETQTSTVPGSRTGGQ